MNAKIGNGQSVIMASGFKIGTVPESNTCRIVLPKIVMIMEILSGNATENKYAYPDNPHVTTRNQIQMK